MFLETIKIKNGEVLNFDLHYCRMKQTACNFRFKLPKIPDLIAIIPENLKNTLVKCRILYRESINSIEFIEYKIRKINSLKIVNHNKIRYDFKFADRCIFEEILLDKKECDDVLIIQNGFVTDTSFSNVALEKNGILFTPKTYLLNGVKRQALISKTAVKEIDIRVQDLLKYNKLYLINSMIDIEDNVCIENIGLKIT